MESHIPSKQKQRRIVLITGALCVACCALPAIGLAIGSATLAGLSIYAEQAGLAIFVVGAALLSWVRLTRKSAPSCKIDWVRNAKKSVD